MQNKETTHITIIFSLRCVIVAIPTLIQQLID